MLQKQSCNLFRNWRKNSRRIQINWKMKWRNFSLNISTKWWVQENSCCFKSRPSELSSHASFLNLWYSKEHWLVSYLSVIVLFLDHFCFTEFPAEGREGKTEIWSEQIHQHDRRWGQSANHFAFPFVDNRSWINLNNYKLWLKHSQYNSQVLPLVRQPTKFLFPESWRSFADWRFDGGVHWESSSPGETTGGWTEQNGRGGSLASCVHPSSGFKSVPKILKFFAIPVIFQASLASNGNIFWSMWSLTMVERNLVLWRRQPSAQQCPFGRKRWRPCAQQVLKPRLRSQIFFAHYGYEWHANDRTDATLNTFPGPFQTLEERLARRKVLVEAHNFKAEQQKEEIHFKKDAHNKALQVRREKSQEKTVYDAHCSSRCIWKSSTWVFHKKRRKSSLMCYSNVTESSQWGPFGFPCSRWWVTVSWWRDRRMSCWRNTRRTWDTWTWFTGNVSSAMAQGSQVYIFWEKNDLQAFLGLPDSLSLDPKSFCFLCGPCDNFCQIRVLCYPFPHWVR